MPILYVTRQGRCCPEVYCDWCAKRIEEAADGNAQWVARPEEGAPSQVYFTHKRCCAAFDEAKHREGLSVGAEELDVFLVYLTNRLGMDGAQWADARGRAAFLASL